MAAPVDSEANSELDGEWSAWITLTAIFMLLIGTLNAIQGLAALFRDEDFWVTFRGEVVTFDITTWGWIQLVFGAFLIIVSILLARDSPFARVAAIILVTLNVVAQFGWATLYPFWALIVVAFDIVILYALVVHGRELRSSSHDRSRP